MMPVLFVFYSEWRSVLHAGWVAFLVVFCFFVCGALDSGCV